MTPLDGSAMETLVSPIVALVTVMFPPLSTIVVRPANRYDDAATVLSVLSVGGSVSSGALGVHVPTKFGLLPEQPPLPRQPGPETSTRSCALRPKVGVPQTRISSLVWNGPLILSLGANWISVQLSEKLCQLAGLPWKIWPVYARLPRPCRQ